MESPKIKTNMDAVTGDIDTYDTYLKKCIRTAITMRKKGIKSNDIVTVCSSTHLNTSIPIIASFFLDAKPSNTDPRFTVADTAHLLKQVNPKMIFVSPEGIELIETVINQLDMTPELVIFGETTKHTPFSEFLKHCEEEDNFQPVEIRDLKETAVVYFSSGSTGLPKGICLSHLSLLSLTFKSNQSAMVLSVSPAYWTSFTVILLTTIISHSCRLILPEFDAETFWSIVSKHKVNHVFTSPMQIAALLQFPPPPQEDLSSLFAIVFGGCPMPEHQLMKLRSYLPNTIVLYVYGLTEISTSGLGFDLSSRHDLQFCVEKPTCCGRPLPGFAYKIVDLETEETLGHNQLGELRIKTEYVMNGYYNLDASSEWDSNGFLRTGDIAYYDEDYCFFVIDRIKEVFKCQGWQISPAKIEAVLSSHPAIANAIVIGLPHPTDTERPTALVVLHDKFVDKVSAKEIELFVERNINDSHRLRGGVKFVEKLFMTPSGKYKRRLMRDLVLGNKL
ncbi:hypothetical protein RI129_010956 [Pyrocoelia pectoralis]|uniref:Luciferin 4-monooxygenase-like n=1 Tax=Pyrocoelia pectoralis TaxID=417401 RepID=A0AAN7Z9Q9_9COLE